MSNKCESYSIIGGDLRQIELAKLLSKQKKKVYVYGLENAKDLVKHENIVMCENLLEVTEKSNMIISSIPFSQDGIYINTPYSTKKIEIKELLKNIKNKTLIVGTIAKEYCNTNNIKIIDIMKDESLAILNTIATAEGTIKIIIENTLKNLQGSNILILGFGRVGKTLAQKLNALLSNVTCASIEKKELALAQVNGYKVLKLQDLKQNIKNYEIIINTIPSLILNSEILEVVNKKTLLIDLASNPGGIDKISVKENNLKLIHALGIPGKVSPISTAMYLEKAILELEE